MKQEQLGGIHLYILHEADNWKFTIVLEQINTKQLPNHRQILATHGTPLAQYPNWDEDET